MRKQLPPWNLRHLLSGPGPRTAPDALHTLHRLIREPNPLLRQAFEVLDVDPFGTPGQCSCGSTHRDPDPPLTFRTEVLQIGDMISVSVPTDPSPITDPLLAPHPRVIPAIRQWTANRAPNESNPINPNPETSWTPNDKPSS